jgi:hypothetical protein
MIRFKALFIALCLLTGGAHAEDDEPFDAMTLTELQAVDTGALDRAEKKLYKKALKAAEKAQKARIKAARKAEKARQKAEKKRRKAEEKRLRAEAKAREKRKKAATKRLKYIDSIHSKTQATRDEFDGSVSVRGPRDSFSDSSYSFVFTLSGDVPFFLRSFYLPHEGRLVTQAYIYMNSDHIIDKASVARAEAAPGRYASRQGLWRNYSRAVQYGGRQLELTPIEREAIVRFGIAKLREEVAVTLDFGDIEAAVRQGTGLDFKLYSASSPDVVFRLPHDYLVGYGLRLSELGTALPLDPAVFRARYEEARQAAAGP